MFSAVKLQEFNFISFIGSQRVRHNLVTEHEHQEVRLELQSRTSGCKWVTVIQSGSTLWDPPGLQPTRLVHKNRKKKKKGSNSSSKKRHVGARINFSFDSDWSSLLSPVLNTRFAVQKVVSLLNEWINSEWMIVNLSMLEQWENNEWKKQWRVPYFKHLGFQRR